MQDQTKKLPKQDLEQSLDKDNLGIITGCGIDDIIEFQAPILSILPPISKISKTSKSTKCSNSKNVDNIYHILNEDPQEIDQGFKEIDQGFKEIGQEFVQSFKEIDQSFKEIGQEIGKDSQDCLIHEKYVLVNTWSEIFEATTYFAPHKNDCGCRKYTKDSKLFGEFVSLFCKKNVNRAKILLISKYLNIVESFSAFENVCKIFEWFVINNVNYYLKINCEKCYNSRPNEYNNIVRNLDTDYLKELAIKLQIPHSLIKF